MPTTRELFSGHDLRCTRQRRALYEALVATKTHPTAEELFRAVKPTTSRLSRATVYNTLEALCKVGLVQRIPFGNGCCRYDADTSEHVHVCLRESGEIRDVPSHLGERLTDQLRRGVITEIEGNLDVEIDVFSIQLMARRTKH